jgi:hypothetical protein
LFEEIYKLNTITEEDKFFLSAFSFMVDNESFLCGRCEAGFKHKQQARGCKEKGGLKHIIAGKKLYDCVGNYYKTEAKFIWDLMLLFLQNGLLPFSGGVAEQPAKVMALIEYSAELKREADDRKRKN